MDQVPLRAQVLNIPHSENDPSSNKKKVIIFLISLFLILLSIVLAILYYKIQLNQVAVPTNDQNAQSAIDYMNKLVTPASTPSGKLVFSLKHNRGERPHYTFAWRKTTNKSYYLSYYLNPTTHKLDEINILIKTSSKSLPTTKDIIAGLNQEYSYLNQPSELLTYKHYPDDVTNNGAIDETYWVNDASSKEIRAGYIVKNKSGDDYIYYLLACRVFAGSVGYINNTCFTRNTN